MMFDEMSAKNEFEVQLLTQSSPIMHPVVISRIADKDLAWKPISYLSRLNEEALTLDSEHIHRVRVSVIATGLSGTTPEAIKDCVRIFDTKSGKSRQADAKATLKGKTECFVFSLPVYVKDFSNLHSN